MMRTPAEQKIFHIIRDDVCGMCMQRPDFHDAGCKHNRPRCYAGYERQAREIYRQLVRPLESGA